jgi:branched-chain amino acid transport system permease protein
VTVFLQFLVNGVIAGSVYALIALGFALIYTASRVFHFAHGGVYTVAAFAGYTVLVKLGGGLVGAFAAAIVVAAALGVLINRTLYEPMRAAGVSAFVMMISSFGVLIILTNVAAIVWGTNPVVLSHGRLVSVLPVGPVFTTGAQLQILGVTAVLAVALLLFFRQTRLGIALRALGSDAELAEVMGMPAAHLRDAAFAVGSGLAGVGALLVGFNVGIIDFNMGFDTILMATVAMIVGGLGNVGAAAGGGIVLGLIQNLAVWQISSKWQQALSFVVLILVLLFRPRGLFGERQPAIGL